MMVKRLNDDNDGKTKRATIKDIARETGVSVATVSYILNGKKSISDETKAKVNAAIAQLDYVPDSAARSLSTKDSLLIGIVIPQTEPGSRLMFENPFYSELFSAIEYETRLHGYHLFISGTGVDESYLYLARKRNLDGIIAIGVYPDEFYQEVKKSKIPLVLIDSYCGDNHCHNIRIDDSYGSYLAASYLLNRGHRDIAFFSGQLRNNGVMHKRLEGFEQAMKEQGLPVRKATVFEGNIDLENGCILARRLLDAKLPVTAVLAAADILAIGAMKGLSEAGLRIPDDISIIGFDDLQIIGYLNPGLTTIRQEIALKGKKAVDILVQNIKTPDLTKREEVLPLSVVERDSVKTLSKEAP
ncbi:MAG: LacI family transcriptional regulator [Treponema sp.]|jgi:LacI family transcriptional regulator|nr:LacI family transcriptional regulator [Treponema sp.]